MRIIKKSKISKCALNYSLKFSLFVLLIAIIIVSWTSDDFQPKLIRFFAELNNGPEEVVALKDGRCPESFVELALSRPNKTDISAYVAKDPARLDHKTLEYEAKFIRIYNETIYILRYEDEINDQYLNFIDSD